MALVSGKKGGYYGCLATSRKGRPAINRKLMRRQQVEHDILGALMKNLLSP